MSGPYNLVLVTGAMRSGTTLLQQVLCTAPDVNPFIHGCRYLTGHATAGDGWRSTVTAEAMSGHSYWSAYLTTLSGGPISAASIGRYREVLSEAEAAQVDRLCADLEDAFARLKSRSGSDGIAEGDPPIL